MGLKQTVVKMVKVGEPTIPSCYPGNNRYQAKADLPRGTMTQQHGWRP